MPTDYEEQINRVIFLLSGKTGLGRESKQFHQCCEWLRNFPASASDSKRKQLLETVCTSFSISEQELYATLANTSIQPFPAASDAEALLESKIKSPWLLDYIAFTRHVEMPMLYGLFSSMCLLGASLGRRVYLDREAYKVLPNYCVLLIGPPACRKTICADFVRAILEEKELCPVFPDQITPEAILDVLQETGGCQFIYAGELSVFLGRQRYNEGLASLMLRLLDSPSVFRKRTRTGDEVVIPDVALTVLGGSTPDLLATATPEQVSGSGFLSRFLIVSINETTRCFSKPRIDWGARQSILERINCMRKHTGVCNFTPEAESWYDGWYKKQWLRVRDEPDRIVGEILARSTVHVERTAMLLHLVDHASYDVCLDCVQQATVLLEEVEHGIPGVARRIESSQRNQDVEYVLSQLKKKGGVLSHSDLLRACSPRMDAKTFRNHVEQLKELGMIAEVKNNAMRFYHVVQQGGEDASS